MRLAKTTKAQRKSIKRLWERLRDSDRPLFGRDNIPTYRQFRATVQQTFDCLMVQWCGMWVGIETDGYTHT